MKLNKLFFLSATIITLLNLTPAFAQNSSPEAKNLFLNSIPTNCAAKLAQVGIPTSEIKKYTEPTPFGTKKLAESALFRTYNITINLRCFESTAPTNSAHATAINVLPDSYCRVFGPKDADKTSDIDECEFPFQWSAQLFAMGKKVDVREYGTLYTGSGSYKYTFNAADLPAIELKCHMTSDGNGKLGFWYSVGGPGLPGAFCD